MNSTRPAGRPPLPAGLVVFVIVMAMGFVFSTGILAFLYLKMRRGEVSAGTPGTIVHIETPKVSDDPLQPDEFVTGLYIPRFDLVDQDEKPVDNSAFKGKITVVDFFFTNCPFICPAMNGAMWKIAGDLKDVPRLQFLSFSVDPVHDTPAKLRDYAKEHDAGPGRWRFLTGKKEQVWNILTEGLKWGIEERPEQPIMLPSGSQMSNIKHPGWFALVGPDGKVLAIYAYDSEQKQKALEERVRAMSKRMESN